MLALRGTHDIVGHSAVIGELRQKILRAAAGDAPVLIQGETGTGKELVARRIHDLSHRAQAPFVPINCGALPENLVESEFFGHRKGAFTGADTARKGLIEVANGGTLFLDELGELDKSMQVKLLRLLESGEVRRVGRRGSSEPGAGARARVHRRFRRAGSRRGTRRRGWRGLRSGQRRGPGR